jgi:chromosome partitioning protein
MKTVAIASAKGGSGKTTIATLLAVRACQDSPNKVAMLDLDSQGSLTQWWTARGEPKSPRLAQIDFESGDNIPATVKKLSATFEWCFLDTPPFAQDVIEQAIVLADAVVIPVKMSLFDVMSSQSVVEMCEQHRKPFSLLLSDVDSRRDYKKLEKEARVAIVDFGTVFSTQIEHRRHYIEAISKGKTGAEIDAKECKREVESLWIEVRRLVGLVEKVRV